MRHVFQEISMRKTHVFKCSCGKSHQKTEKFYQTVNPFNKNKSGEVKTADEIRQELRAEKAAWPKTPLKCPRHEEHGEVRP